MGYSLGSLRISHDCVINTQREIRRKKNNNLALIDITKLKRVNLNKKKRSYLNYIKRLKSKYKFQEKIEEVRSIFTV